MAFISGSRETFDDQDDHILDLRMGLDFLNPAQDGIAFIKKIGINGFRAKSYKHEWTETELAGRSEAVTITTTTTTLTVADAYIYQVNDLIRIVDEVVRVTAVASATTLTIVRGYGDTVDPGSTHTAETAVLLGSADPENSAAPAGQSDTATRLFNYVQTFTRSVDLSNDEIAQLSTDGNPLVGQVKRRFIEIVRQLSASIFYNERYSDTTNNISAMGGLHFYLSTNVTAVGGALTVAAIDAEIKAIVDAGGDPKVLVMGTDQKQALDALDASLVRIGKKERMGGNPDTQTWQSGLLTHTVDVIVDHTIRSDELWILDTDHLSVGYLSNNGVNGGFAVSDATTPGTDGVKKVIRGKYTLMVGQEKSHALLTGLS